MGGPDDHDRGLGADPLPVTCEAEVRMGQIFGDRILRCSDGHLFTSTVRTRLFGSTHLGPRRYMTCPVDGRRRLCENAWKRDLTQEQIEQAQHYRA